MKTIIALLLSALMVCAPGVAQNRNAAGMRFSKLGNHNALNLDGLVSAWDFGGQRNLLKYSSDLTNAAWVDWYTSHTINTITFVGGDTMYQVVPLAVGSTYTISALASSTTAKKFRFEYHTDGAGTFYGGNITPSSTLTRYSWTFTVGAGSVENSNVAISDASVTSAGTITITNIQLELGSLPSVFQPTTDLQLAPNAASPGTYDLQRGGAGADTGDFTWTGSSASFDGTDDYATVALTIPQNGPATIMQVMKYPQTASARGAHQPAFSGLYQNSANDAWYLFPSATSNYFAIGPVANQWNHIALTYDGPQSTGLLYTKGVKWAVTEQGPNTVFSAVTTFEVSKVSTTYAAGYVAQTIIYNRAISASEVAKSYTYLKRLNAERNVILP